MGVDIYTSDTKTEISNKFGMIVDMPGNAECSGSCSKGHSDSCICDSLDTFDIAG